jgi:hypothetical protein
LTSGISFPLWNACTMKFEVPSCVNVTTDFDDGGVTAFVAVCPLPWMNRHDGEVAVAGGAVCDCVGTAASAPGRPSPGRPGMYVRTPPCPEQTGYDRV